MLLLQILQERISSVSFQISSFKAFPHSSFDTRKAENILLSKTKRIFFKNSFFPQLLSSGIVLTIKFEKLEVLVLLKIIS